MTAQELRDAAAKLRAGAGNVIGTAAEVTDPEAVFVALTDQEAAAWLEDEAEAVAPEGQSSLFGDVERAPNPNALALARRVNEAAS